MSKDTATILAELQQGVSYPADIAFLKAERDEAREETARLRAEVERYKRIEQAARAVVAVWMSGLSEGSLTDTMDALEHVLHTYRHLSAPDQATEEGDRWVTR